MSASTRHGNTDWRPVKDLYAQVTAIVDRIYGGSADLDLPRRLAEVLAESIGRRFNAYSQAEEFVIALRQVMSEVDNINGDAKHQFRELYNDRRFSVIPSYREAIAVGERRRPTPFEASVETARRIRDLNKVHDAIHADAECLTSGVLGGSASYGRFLNVVGPKGSTKASDLDLLIVVQDYGAVLDRLPKLLHNVPGVTAGDLDKFDRRIKRFNAIRDSYTGAEPIVITQKVRMWENHDDSLFLWPQHEQNYTLTVTVCSLGAFHHITLADCESLDGCGVRQIGEFRDGAGQAKDAVQRSFAGTAIIKPRAPADAVHEGELGVVWRNHVALLEDERYYPGVLQNVILPRLDHRWDDAEVGLTYELKEFRYKLIERLRTEKALRPRERQRISYSHTRHLVFTNRIAEFIDAEDDVV